MSSRDRRNQPKRNPYGFDSDATDDQFIVERWNDDGLDEELPQQPPRQTHRRTAPSSPTGTSIEGTAAQIDRLRRAVRENARNQPAESAAAPSPRASGQRRNAEPDTYAQFDDFDDEPPRRTAPASQYETQNQSAYDPYEEDEWEDDATGYYVASGGDAQYDDDDAYADTYDLPAPATARPQIGMPTISRPSLPPAIANAAVVNDAPALALIGTGIASLAAMAILTANRIDTLEPGFASHVSASGVFENVVPSSAFWHLPLMATMLTLMAFVIAWFVAPLDRFASRFVLGAALLVQFMAWIAVIRIL